MRRSRQPSAPQCSQKILYQAWETEQAGHKTNGLKAKVDIARGKSFSIIGTDRRSIKRPHQSRFSFPQTVFCSTVHSTFSSNHDRRRNDVEIVGQIRSRRLAGVDEQVGIAATVGSAGDAVCTVPEHVGTSSALLDDGQGSHTSIEDEAKTNQTLATPKVN